MPYEDERPSCSHDGQNPNDEEEQQQQQQSTAADEEKEDDPINMQQDKGGGGGGGGGSNDSSSSSSSASVCCAVCSQDITDLKQQVHYGAHACFCCRAFFRRAQNAKRRANWRCYVEGKCVINEKSRRFCTWCRYQKCLEVGMKESLVLSEDEKKHRFRKVLKRKRKMAKDKVVAQREHAQVEACSLKDVGSSSRGKARLSAIEKLLMDIHSGKVMPTFTFQQIKDLITLMKGRFDTFALAQDEFLALMRCDRRDLSANNMASYIQCILCQYFICSDGGEQVKMVMENREETTTAAAATVYSKVSIQDVDKYTLVKMFGVDCMLKKAFVSLLVSTCGGLDKMKPDFPAIHKMILFTHGNDVDVDSSTDDSTAMEPGSSSAEFHHITEFQKDLALLSNILVVLYHSHICLPRFHLQGYDLTRDAFFRLVQERSHFEVRRIVVGHQNQIDGNLLSLISCKIPQIMFLFLVRLDLARTLAEQFKILSHSQKNKAPTAGEHEHFVIFDHSGKSVAKVHPVREKRFQMLLLDWRNCLGEPDIFFLIVMLAIFSPRNALPSAAEEDEGVVQLKKSYMTVLLAAVTPQRENLYASISSCLESLNEVTDLCPSFP